MSLFRTAARLLVLALVLASVSPLGLASGGLDVGALDRDAARLTAATRHDGHLGLPSSRPMMARLAAVRVRLPRLSRLAVITSPAPIFAVAVSDAPPSPAAAAISAAPRALVAPRPPPVL